MLLMVSLCSRFFPNIVLFKLLQAYLPMLLPRSVQQLLLLLIVLLPVLPVTWRHPEVDRLCALQRDCRALHQDRLRNDDLWLRESPDVDAAIDAGLTDLDRHADIGRESRRCEAQPRGNEHVLHGRSPEFRFGLLAWAACRGERAASSRHRGWAAPARSSSGCHQGSGTGRWPTAPPAPACRAAATSAAQQPVPSSGRLRTRARHPIRAAGRTAACRRPAGPGSAATRPRPATASFLEAPRPSNYRGGAGETSVYKRTLDWPAARHGRTGRSVRRATQRQLCISAPGAWAGHVAHAPWAGRYQHLSATRLVPGAPVAVSVSHGADGPP